MHDQSRSVETKFVGQATAAQRAALLPPSLQSAIGGASGGSDGAEIKPELFRNGDAIVETVGKS